MKKKHTYTDDTYDVPVDPKQADKATVFKLNSLKRPHMRAFHFAWFGFFMAFVSWFAFAPLMREIKGDLGMTTNEVYNANISSVSSTVLSRFVVGPLCDTFGARIISSTLLIMGCIPTFFAGLVDNAVDVAVVRFFIGVMGAAFVCTQFWSSQIFVKEFVGTANATTGGWGNLGGGVTQVGVGLTDSHSCPPGVSHYHSARFGSVCIDNLYSKKTKVVLHTVYEYSDLKQRRRRYAGVGVGVRGLRRRRSKNVSQALPPPPMKPLAGVAVTPAKRWVPSHARMTSPRTKQPCCAQGFGRL